MPSLISQYEADRGSLARFYVVVNSPERRVRFKKFNEEYLSELQQLNFDKLTTSDRVDYILLKRNIDNELLLLAREEEEYKQIATYIPFADSIYLLEKLRRRGATLNAKDVAGQLTTINDQLQKVTRKLRGEGNLSRSLADRAEATVKGLQAALKSVFDFYNSYDPEFTWWIPIVYRRVDTSLTRYANLIATKSSRDTTDRSSIAGQPNDKDEVIL